MSAVLAWLWVLGCAALGVAAALGHHGCGYAAVLLFVGGEALLPEPGGARRERS